MNRQLVDRLSNESDIQRREIGSFIEPRAPLINPYGPYPFKRPKPVHLTFEDDTLLEDDNEVDKEYYKVYLRLKPTEIPSDIYEIKSNTTLVTSALDVEKRGQTKVSQLYKFSQIFGPKCRQREVFDHTVKDSLNGLKHHNSFTLLTYGASGSGKTFTLIGKVKQEGLIPRSLDYLFRILTACDTPKYKPKDGTVEKLTLSQQTEEIQIVNSMRRSCNRSKTYNRMSVNLSSEFLSATNLVEEAQYYIWVSFVEIYNESIFDLLEPTTNKCTKLRICEDPKYGTYIKGLRHVFVRSGNEAFDVMLSGQENLKYAATGIHTNSSRSHSIFTVNVLAVYSDDKMYTSRLRLCDLAGAERAARTENSGQRMTESRHINTSLHVLERCLRTLRQRQKQTNHLLVPYRESKLTRVLGGALSGAKNENVSIVVTVNPDPLFKQETKHVLKLVSVARSISVNTTVAQDTTSSSQENNTTIVDNYKEEILALRAENDRIHFELERALTSFKRAVSEANEERESNADLMKELVEQTRKDSETFYMKYIEELKRKHEDQLNEIQMENQELIKLNAVHEENLYAAELRIANLEAEIQYLRGCVDERDDDSVKDQECIKTLEAEIDLNTSSSGEDSNTESDSDTSQENVNDSEVSQNDKSMRESVECIERNIIKESIHTTDESDCIHDTSENSNLDSTDASLPSGVSENISHKAVEDTLCNESNVKLNYEDSVPIKSPKGLKDTDEKHNAQERNGDEDNNNADVNIENNCNQLDIVNKNDSGLAEDTSETTLEVTENLSEQLVCRKTEDPEEKENSVSLDQTGSKTNESGDRTQETFVNPQSVLASIENKQVDVMRDDTKASENNIPMSDVDPDSVKKPPKSARRRKLWTPHIEVETTSEAGDSDDSSSGKLRVLRPSYRRTRARRKL